MATSTTTAAAPTSAEQPAMVVTLTRPRSSLELLSQTAAWKQESDQEPTVQRIDETSNAADDYNTSVVPVNTDTIGGTSRPTEQNTAAASAVWATDISSNSSNSNICGSSCSSSNKITTQSATSTSSETTDGTIMIDGRSSTPIEHVVKSSSYLPPPLSHGSTYSNDGSASVCQYGFIVGIADTDDTGVGVLGSPLGNYMKNNNVSLFLPTANMSNFPKFPSELYLSNHHNLGGSIAPTDLKGSQDQPQHTVATNIKREEESDETTKTATTTTTTTGDSDDKSSMTEYEKKLNDLLQNNVLSRGANGIINVDDNTPVPMTATSFHRELSNVSNTSQMSDILAGGVVHATTKPSSTKLPEDTRRTTKYSDAFVPPRSTLTQRSSQPTTTTTTITSAAADTYSTIIAPSATDTIDSSKTLNPSVAPATGTVVHASNYTSNYINTNNVPIAFAPSAASVNTSTIPFPNYQIPVFQWQCQQSPESLNPSVISNPNTFANATQFVTLNSSHQQSFQQYMTTSIPSSNAAVSASMPVLDVHTSTVTIPNNSVATTTTTPAPVPLAAAPPLPPSCFTAGSTSYPSDSDFTLVAAAAAGRENFMLRQQLLELQNTILSLQNRVQQLESENNQLRQLPTGKISQIPLEDMIELMQMYGSEISDATLPPRKNCIQKASVVRQFRRWNPNFVEYFEHVNGRWVPKLGREGELKRREQSRREAALIKKKTTKDPDE